MKIELKRVKGKESEEISTAFNTVVLIDGVQVKNLQSISIDLSIENIVPIVILKLIPTELLVDDHLEVLELTNIDKVKELVKNNEH